MSTKAQNVTVFNEIADGQANTALEVRNALNKINDNLYFPPVRESTSGTHANTNSLIPAIVYNIILAKQGNHVLVSGTLQNTSGVNLSASNLVDIITPEYQGRTDFDTSFKESVSGVTLAFSATKIYLVNTLPAGATVRINHTYLTND